MARISTLLAGLLILGGCSQGESDEAQVRRAFGEYDAAVKAGNLDALRSKVAGEKAAELSKPEAAPMLQLASKMRPADASVQKCTVTGERASLEIRGTAEGKPATGTVSMVREQGTWRLDKEDWQITMDLTGAMPGAPEEPAAPPAPESMKPAVRKQLDGVASSKPDEGAKAWEDLGTPYQSASSFLKDLRPALWDERPVTFILVEESFTGGGKTFRYFSAKVPTAGAKAQRAATVGEALRYHLWRLEDAGNSGFKGGFAEWWAKYAVPRKLPAFP